MVTAGPLILRLPPPPPPPGQNVLLEERKLLNTHGRIKLVCSSVVVGSVVAPSSQINGSSLLLTDGAEYVDVVMGAHNIRQNEESQVTVRSDTLMTHEDYNSFSLHNDIGLIQLPSPIIFNDNIRSVALASLDPGVGTTVTLTGWGKSDQALGITDVLRQVDAPIMSNDECAETYTYVIYPGTICISAEGGKGVCSGDSGGPMNWNGVTAGVTSLVASAGCESGLPHGFTSESGLPHGFTSESGLPHGFTRVTYFLDWIQANSGITP
ncbi:hypothetical protein Pcinc_039795 [Petrolisthes cinctipes]|uniref:Peptidase S1 domain-containing protein n=1 Tax=Petrolisthes cinctipes TaxID=88211 RepID=A0AAE1BMR3_PETCI|nr:hypothetical protein Pcinc_039795 [Petrolisthes cinctipes]